MVSVNAINVNQPSFKGLDPEDTVKLIRVLGAFEGEGGDEFALGNASKTCNELSQKTNNKALKTVLGIVGGVSTIAVSAFAYKKGIGVLANLGGFVKDKITKKPFDPAASSEKLTKMVQRIFKDKSGQVQELLQRFDIKDTKELLINILAGSAAMFTGGAVFSGAKGSGKDKEQDTKIAELQQTVDTVIREVGKIDSDAATQVMERAVSGEMKIDEVADFAENTISFFPKEEAA